MTDLPAKVPGAPGTVYEATWGRKTMKSKTFIGRVHALVESGNGGLQVFACDHKHPRPGQRPGLRAWRGAGPCQTRAGRLPRAR
jgi:hypothetical protein